VVADCEESGEAGESARHIGIVTLHNIFETILQTQDGGFAELQEEDSMSRRRVLRQAGAVHIFHPCRMSRMAGEPLGEQEAEAVLSFLSVNAPEFSPRLVSGEELLALLREVRALRFAKRDVLYRRSEEASFGTLVLHGAVGVVSGEEGFESTMGPLSCIGMRALELPEVARADAEKRTREGELRRWESTTYVPDFTASVLTDGCLVIKIDRSRYFEAHLRTKYGRA